MTAGLPAAAGQDGTSGEDGASGEGGTRGVGGASGRNGTSGQHGTSEEGGAPRPDPAPGRPDPAPRSDDVAVSPAADGSSAGRDPGAPDHGPGAGAPEDDGTPPATARARMAGWLRTVPGLAASTAVTTLAAAAATAVFTGALHLWPTSSEPKVSLSVETDPMRLDAEGDLVQLVPAARFDRTRPQNGCADFWSWARARGGVDEGQTTMQLTVTNSGSNTVLITGMRAQITSREPVSNVVETECRTQGKAKVYAVHIDLDKPQPYGLYDKNGKSLPPEFTVAAGDLETFLVTARIGHGAAHWNLAVDLVEGGHERSIVVDDDGKPFTTVTRPAHPTVWELDPHGGGWLSPLGEDVPTGQASGSS